MNKKISIGIAIVITITVIGLAWWYFAQKSYENRVEDGDTIKILTNIVTQSTTAMLAMSNTTASDAEKRKFEIKMGGCMLLSLMRMPEVKDFEYITLKEKAEIAVKAMQTTYRQQYMSDMRDCYNNLDADLKNKIVLKF